MACVKAYSGVGSEPDVLQEGRSDSLQGGLNRVLRCLKAFLDNPEGLHLNELRVSLGVSRRTAFRYLELFRHAGFSVTSQRGRSMYRVTLPLDRPVVGSPAWPAARTTVTAQPPSEAREKGFYLGRIIG